MKPEEQELILKDLRISKIEWTAVDSITTLRFTFSTGQTTPQIGTHVPLRNSYTLPKGADIGKIIVGVRNGLDYIDYLAFMNKKGEMLVEFEGENQTGPKSFIELEEEEYIIGVHCTQCEKYVRGIGFYVFRPGIGIPNLQD